MRSVCTSLYQNRTSQYGLLVEVTDRDMLHSSSSDEDGFDGDSIDVSDYGVGTGSFHPSAQHPAVSSAQNSRDGGREGYYSSRDSHGSNNKRDSVGATSVAGTTVSGHVSTKSNCSGSSGSPGSTRAASFEYPKHGGSSFDTVSISSGLSVPPASVGYSENRSYDGTPRHERYHSNNNSRSNSFRGSDRSPQPAKRSGSPTSSIISDREREDMERLSIEEDDHKRRLQIYVFVLRCIAFPFNAKQPHDMQKRQAKINKQEIAKIKEKFAAFLTGETSIMADEAFKNAVQSYYEVFLKSDRVTSMVRSGACSATDFREVFKNNIEKRVRSLPEIDGLSKETVLSSWMTKFDTIYRGTDGDSRKHQRTISASNELILSKDQLYEMFQNILSIKKYEHLILYNALQVRLFLSYPDQRSELHRNRPTESLDSAFPRMYKVFARTGNRARDPECKAQYAIH